jgi:glyoxalase family protein
MTTISPGIHHVTAIAGDPRKNVAFYRDVLGLRLVKKTVNFDDPGTYHLYYGDETGAPGTIITFFPWAGVNRGRAGLGMAVETAYAIPRAAVPYWIERLIAKGVDHDPPLKRFGETVIGLRDPDGAHLELVAIEGVESLPGWAGGPVPIEYGIRGFAGQTLWVADPAPTARVLTEVFGYVEAGADGAWRRYVAPGDAIARRIDLRVAAGFMRGAPGAGTIHHVAFRAADDAAQTAMSKALAGLGLRATEQLDRNYFRSIYFREPGGVLFEIATDAPGFDVDEPRASLGETLMLPTWLEGHRKEIEAHLPALG